MSWSARCERVYVHVRAPVWCMWHSMGRKCFLDAQNAHFLGLMPLLVTRGLGKCGSLGVEPSMRTAEVAQGGRAPALQQLCSS